MERGGLGKEGGWDRETEREWAGAHNHPSGMDRLKPDHLWPNFHCIF